MRWQISEASEKVWKHWGMGWSLFAIFAVLCVWWLPHTPSIGYSIGALAVVASVMAALMENLRALARFAWIILLFGFLWVEMRAIDEDKRKTTQELTDHFQGISTQAHENLKQILDEERKNLQDILTTEQADFSKTISQLLRQEREQAQEFNAILTKQQQLFDHQQEFAEFLNGKLLPASDPMPPNICHQIQSNDVAVFLGTNAMVTNKFPHTILQVQGQSVVSIDRLENGSVVLSVEMRDTSNRIIARLNKNGFVVNSSYALYMLRPDKSTIIIEDQYGKEVLNARFLNRQAFRLNGVLQYRATAFPLDLPNFKNSCFSNNGVDIAIN